MVSIDVERDLGNVTGTLYGVENFHKILEVFDGFGIRATLFINGDVLENYPKQVESWAKQHEIACHGYYHTPLFELSAGDREVQLINFIRLYQKILGGKARGFRAIQHTIDDLQMRLLEKYDFLYDSSVIPRYVPFRKYVGYRGKAPVEPYHPASDDLKKKGNMKLWEIPNTPLMFGIPLYGTWLRFFEPKFFKILLNIKKPPFLNFAMHSWDTIKYTGPFSRNSGPVFIEFLSNMLETLGKDYDFKCGERLARAGNDKTEKGHEVTSEI